MTFRILHDPDANPARSPFRVVEQTTSREVDWVNRYLDLLALRRLAPLTIRSCAHELLHFVRWWDSLHRTPAITPEALTDSILLEYVRFQSSHQPPFAGATINQRVAVVDRALRCLFPEAPPADCSGAAGPLLATCSHGSGQASHCAQPRAGERRKAYHRSAFGRRGGTILGELPHIT
jgi:hypothetical protein